MTAITNITIPNPLPNLAGSEKQVAWATDIRAEFMSTEDPIAGRSSLNWVKLVLTLPVEKPKELYEKALLIQVFNFIICQQQAAWWIENMEALDSKNFKIGWKRMAPDDMKIQAFKDVPEYIPSRGRDLELYNRQGS